MIEYKGGDGGIRVCGVVCVCVCVCAGCILIFHPGFQGFQGRVLGVLGLFQGFSTRILANFRVLPQPIISAFLDRIPHFHVSRPPNPLSSIICLE